MVAPPGTTNAGGPTRHSIAPTNPVTGLQSAVKVGARAGRGNPRRPSQLLRYAARRSKYLVSTLLPKPVGELSGGENARAIMATNGEQVAVTTDDELGTRRRGHGADFIVQRVFQLPLVSVQAARSWPRTRVRSERARPRSVRRRTSGGERLEAPPQGRHR